MKSYIDILTACIFTVIFFCFIFLTRKTKTFKNFAVSDNSIGLFLIFMSFSATFIGPGFSMALVNQGNKTGLFYLLIAGFYGLAKIVEGQFFAPKIRERFSDALSIGDIIAGKKTHNNKYLQILVGIISFGLLIGFSTVLTKAGGEILNGLFGITRSLGMIIMTSVVVFYSFFGGIKATIMTDAFQLILFFILFIFLYLSFFTKGITFDQISGNITTLTNNAFATTTVYQVIGLITTWFFGEMLIPPTINRIISTKSVVISKKGLIFSGIFMIIWLIGMLYLGVLAKSVYPDIEASDQLLIVIAKNQLNYGLYGVFAVAIVGIVMSSQDSLVNAGATVFTNDIYGVFKKLNDTHKLYLARTATILIGICSIIFALYLPSILEGLLLVYSFWAPAILVPLFASIFLHKWSWKSATASMLTGIVVSLVWGNFSISQYIPTIFAGLFFSCISYFIIFIIDVKLKRWSVI